jgi:hypothetical protein
MDIVSKATCQTGHVPNEALPSITRRATLPADRSARREACVIYPLVDESEEVDLRAASGSRSRTTSAGASAAARTSGTAACRISIRSPTRGASGLPRSSANRGRSGSV